MVPTRKAIILLALGLVPLLVPCAYPIVLYVALALDVLAVVLVLSEYFLLRKSVDIKITRDVGHRFSIGESHNITLKIQSYSKRRINLMLKDDPPASFSCESSEMGFDLPPYGERTISYPVVPLKRGNHDFGDIHYQARGGLGFTTLHGKIESLLSVKVYPNLKSLRRLELASRFLRQELGFRAMRREGAGDEFEKLREYLPDDEFRHIDWKATARRHKPITRVYETERNQTMLLCIDTSRLMAAHSGSLSKLDHAINAALLLAYSAIRFDDQVGLLVFSSTVESYLPPKKGNAQFRRILERLYAAKAKLNYVDYREAVRHLRSQLTRRALVIFLTDLLDKDTARPFVKHTRMLVPRHLPLTITISDPLMNRIAGTSPESIEAVYSQVVAYELIQERESVKKQLLSLGAQVIDEPADRLSAASVNKYIELKRNQRI